MAELQGLATFPGIQQVRHWQMTFSHGIDPSECLLEIVPQVGGIAENGALVITFGNVGLTFPGCRVIAPSVRRDTSSGMIMQLRIQDRRWRWRFGEVYGRYNIKRADGKVDTIRSQEKTPQELAKILLEAMGEANFDVSALPNTRKFEKVWDGGVPAEELAQLCDDLGCRVVLNPLDNRVKIVKLGTGEQLPDNGLQRTLNYGVQLTARPDSIRVLMGPTVFQSKLKLEAVGLDSDGRIKPIADLTYIPATSGGGGYTKSWVEENPDEFAGVTNLADRRLAVRTVFRWYRIKSQADGSLAPPTFPKPVTYIRQLLPIRSTLVERHLNRDHDPQDLQTEDELPAYVEGVFGLKYSDFGNTDTTSDIQQEATTDGDGNTVFGSRYVGGFTIDEARGIVMFNDWVVKWGSAEDTVLEPELYLCCSYSCVDYDRKLPFRYQVERKLPGPSLGTGPKVIQVPDLFNVIVAKYGSNQKRVEKTVDNVREIETQANEMLDNALLEFQQPATQQVEYAGVIPIGLDGAILQVSWEGGTNTGARTIASRGTEFDPVIPNYAEKRRQQRTKKIQAVAFSEPVIVGGV